MSEAESGGKLVCVTGASGYIASWLVKLLLRCGYTVRATVRDPNDPNKTEHLFALEGAKERLYLFKADLVEEGSFDDVVNGCVGVFHTASPVIVSVTDPQAELIDPAVRGTLNVLKSCARSPSVKRVVVTSSLSTLTFSGKTLTEDVVIDETWFSDKTFCEKQKLWYMLSKILAEEAACKFAKENNLELVVFNPGVVIGPLLQPTLNFSVEIIMGFINGVQKFPATSYRFVDVRDVAFAHVQALEVPSAEGRYCLVGKAVHNYEVPRILHHLFPTLVLAETSDDDKKVVPMHRVSQERAKSLGVKFMTLEDSLRDTIESLKEMKLIAV